MSITKNTEYALRALYEIAETGRGNPVSRRVISEKQGISEPFLEKICLPMQKAGIIKSVRGPGGGFLLGRSAADITVWDVFSAVDSKSHFYEKCAAVKDRECEHYKKCKIKTVWPKINRALKDSMSDISLKDIAGENVLKEV
ncbi:MAG: Rrf2 family transcriptional regulator [Candidatus Aminicenantes bacterium]|nr:Rrf2 family transcriptional regulator [Candidatus Aminicenantes bacterium]